MSDDVYLITGASGFIGGYLAERLSGEGMRVRCLVRSSSDTSLLDQLDVGLSVGDLTDADSLERAAGGCRYVFHCGALVSDWATVEEIRRINVEGTRNVLRAAQAVGADRLVYLSTTDVYGYPGARSVTETHKAKRFTNWYAHTKALAEAEVRRVGRGGRLETVILRPATVYGPRSKEVIGDIARAIRGRNMLLIDRGRANAGLCYVGNLLDAMLLVLDGEAPVGEAFNVTDGLEVSWKQFTDDLADGLGSAHVRWSVPYWAAYGVGLTLELGYRGLRRATGLRTPPLLSRQAVHVLGKSQDFSNRKLRALGWEPRVDYAAGLAATLAWLRTELPVA